MIIIFQRTASYVLILENWKREKTAELLCALKSANNEKLYLFIFGRIPEEEQEILIPLINRNDNVFFLGWKSNEEITDFLAGVDLYCQPGTQSATLQVALCCGCAAMVYPYTSYVHLTDDKCFYVKSENEMKDLFEK